MSIDETEILRLIDAWDKALEAKDGDRMTADYAEDVLVFDPVPPYQTVGAAAYRESWKSVFPMFPENFRTARKNVSVRVSGGLAVVHCLHNLLDMDGEPLGGRTWMRVTVALERRDGRWLVVHEHVSVPFDPRSGKAAFIHSI